MVDHAPDWLKGVLDGGRSSDLADGGSPSDDGGGGEPPMLEQRVEALEERAGRIESKLDTVAVKLDLMAQQQAEMRADMKTLAKDLKSVEVTQADMHGRLSQMPSTWTMMVTFLGTSLALVTMVMGGIALIPVFQDWARQALS